MTHIKQTGSKMSEIAYKSQLSQVLVTGCSREDRTGTGTIARFSVTESYHLSDGFPLMTSRMMRWGAIVDELLWFLSGSTNIADLNEAKHWWAPFADEKGFVGPMYGYQWRKAGGIDQIANVIDSIKNNPNSRRHVVSAWNTEDIQYMSLPPCHTLFQFFVDRGLLHCHLYQRSGDMFLGVPANIASYSLLTAMIAHVTDLKPGVFTHTIGDAHIYKNHKEQVKEYIKADMYPAPGLIIDGPKDIDQLCKEGTFSLENYKHGPEIKAKLAV